MSLTETLFNSITFTVINEFGKGAAVEIETVFWPVYHIACQRILSKGTASTFFEPIISEYAISEIHKL